MLGWPVKSQGFQSSAGITAVRLSEGSFTGSLYTGLTILGLDIFVGLEQFLDLIGNQFCFGTDDDLQVVTPPD